MGIRTIRATQWGEDEARSNLFHESPVEKWCVHLLNFWFDFMPNR